MSAGVHAVGRAGLAVIAWPLLFACLAILWPARSWGQVQIVRELPPSGESPAQAQWGPPLPSAETAAPSRGVQAGGRIALGTSGGYNDQGSPTLDAFVESNLSLLVPLGGTSSFVLTGDAARRPSLLGLGQAYKAAAALNFDAWQAEVGGGYHSQDNNASTGSTGELGGDAHASVTVSAIPTLPMSATYSFQRLVQNQSDFTGAFARITDSTSHTAALKANGTLGSVGLTTGADFSDVTDNARSMETTSFGGTVDVTIPVTSYLKVFTTFLPKYSATTYSQSGNSAANTSMEGDAGVLLPISEQLSIRVGAGTIGQWSAQAGPSAGTDPTVPSSSLTVKGLTGVEWKPAAALSASATYGFGKVIAGPFVHSLDALLGYHGEAESLLKAADVGGSVVLSLDGTGALVNSQATWKTSAGLGSQDALAVIASYSGSEDGISQPSLTNTAHLGVTHQVIPELSYALAGDLTNSLGPQVQPTLLQTYQARLTALPHLAGRTVTLSSDETVALDVFQSPTLVVSKAGAGFSVPILAALNTHYRFDWEWDSATAPGTGPDSQFKNTVGFTVGGQPVPITFTAEYALSFGFRGLRHDGTASFNASLWKGFELTSTLAISEYDPGTGPTVPFLATIGGAYSF